MFAANAHSVAEARLQGGGVALGLRGSFALRMVRKAKRGECSKAGIRSNSEVPVWREAKTNRINISTSHKYKLIDDWNIKRHCVIYSTGENNGREGVLGITFRNM